MLSAQLCPGALLSVKRGMNQVDGKQMDIHRGTVCQTASTMTAVRGVTPGLLTKDGSNHGTLGWPGSWARVFLDRPSSREAHAS